MLKIFKQFLKTFFKKRCILCKKECKKGHLLCEECLNKLIIESKNNKIIRRKIYNNYNVYSCFFYEKEIKLLIKELKYNRNKKVAKILAIILNNLIKKAEENNNNESNNQSKEIIPVPIHFIRKFNRQFNQMELVTIELSKISKMRYNFNFIKKIKYTKPLYKLNREKRIKEIKNAFKVNKGKGKEERKIIIIDDIITTGSTLSECVKTINKAGYKEIELYTIASTRIKEVE